MEVQQAVDIVAQHVLASKVEAITESGWEDYPDMGEHSWEDVATKVAQLCPYPEGALFDQAYALLTTLADTEA